MTDDEPLRNADMGEQTTVATTAEMPLTLREPDAWYRSDIVLGEQRIRSIDVRENVHGEPRVVVEWERDATKGVGRRWDQHDQPVTDAERQQERRGKWIKRVVSFVSFVLPVAVALFVTKRVMNQISGVTFNGEPLGPVTYVDVVAPFLAVVAMAAFIVWSLKYMPGMAGMRRA